jgi:hypothetical protein
MRGALLALGGSLAAGLVLVGAGLWVFNTLEVTPGPCPQDVPVKCTPGPRVAFPSMGLILAAGGVLLTGLAFFLLQYDLRLWRT